MSEASRAGVREKAAGRGAGGAAGRQVELTAIHDFAAKLRHPDILPRLREYVLWQARLRGTAAGGTAASGERVPDYAPVSINLDITTACNFACDHCVDMAILNTGVKYRHDELLASLRLMADKGLRSVIVIGGGEPTLYPRFEETIRFLKDLGLQVAVVSNGSGQGKIAAIAPHLGEGDWIRLSLDAGTDPTFQAMHRPRKPITLEAICATVPAIKEANPRFPLGFSFIITWKGASIHDGSIVENIHEIVEATALARRHRFDYIAFKPFLTRASDNNAEIVDVGGSQAGIAEVAARIRQAVEEAKKLATPSFRVIETTNLKVLENRSFRDYSEQPKQCHMQFFRQVLSPLGMYHCPVYRNQPHGRLGPADAYAGAAGHDRIRREAASLLGSFDASRQCREVTCLYNHANWWIEGLIEHPEGLERLEPHLPREPDFFL